MGSEKDLYKLLKENISLTVHLKIAEDFSLHIFGLTIWVHKWLGISYHPLCLQKAMEVKFSLHAS